MKFQAFGTANMGSVVQHETRIGKKRGHDKIDAGKLIHIFKNLLNAIWRNAGKTAFGNNEMVEQINPEDLPRFKKLSGNIPIFLG